MKVYTLTQPAYGQRPGTSLALDETDPMVKMNVEAGVLVAGTEHAVESAKMTCPICEETMKRPTKVADADNLATHYAEKHAGFVVPAYQPDTEE